nr:hypothetical protein [Solirubrobacterales bacterium]
MPELAAPVGRLGSLAIVLHSHMPYVEGFGTYPFGEEWLFDAYLRSYLPVLEVAERLTLTVTPVLADQLEAPGVGERLERFVTELRVGYCRREAGAIGGELGAACEAEASRYEHALETLRGLAGELLSPFTEASAAGRVALMSSAAAHAVLPLLATRAARRLQIDAGLRSHHRRFGAPAGFWLPECAYEPGLEGELAELGVEAFCVDQSEFLDPVQTLAPIATAAGPTALAIDWGLISRLWSLSGYPSDPAHQDFHRKSIWGARPWSIAGAPYDPARAQAIARRQAADLTDALGERFRAGAPDGDGLVVFAIDTELIGHWWWEGPIWLAELIRLAPGAGIELVTVPQAVERHSAEPRPLRSSSWGEGKDLRS